MTKVYFEDLRAGEVYRETGDRLRRMSDLEARGLDPQDMAEGYGLLRSDLPVLNEARRRVAGSGA